MTKIDYPANTTRVWFWTGDEPEANGESMRYGSWDRGAPSDKTIWAELGYATGSDYSGSLVEVSNYNGLCELLEEHHPEGSVPVVWCRTHGGHGTFGLLVRYELLAEEVREAIDGLEDYPLLDNEAHSELECEAQNEAWESWAKRDFERAVCKHYGECDWPEGVDSYELFHVASDRASEYWINEQGSDMWIRLEPIVAEALRLIQGGEVSYVSADFVAMLDAAPALFSAAQAAEEAK
jgi:hypothetical protein